MRQWRFLRANLDEMFKKFKEDLILNEERVNRSILHSFLNIIYFDIFLRYILTLFEALFYNKQANYILSISNYLYDTLVK